MALATGLSGNEIYCLKLKQFRAGELVTGNSIRATGVLSRYGFKLGSLFGDELPPATQALHSARLAAFERMRRQAEARGASGVTGVSAELRAYCGVTEFLSLGSCVHAETDAPFFTNAGSAQDLYCYLDAGYRPINFIFGNVAYATRLGRGLSSALKTFGRGEVAEFSDLFSHSRHAALDRLVAQARHDGANAIVGVRLAIQRWGGAQELVLTGTSAFNAALPASAETTPASCSLSGGDLWAMTSLGYAPARFLMSTAIYSLGRTGGLLAALKPLVKIELDATARLIEEARETVIGRLKREADGLGAVAVAGVTTSIAELGAGLVEVTASGAALTQAPNVGVATPTLPPQAIGRDDNELRWDRRQRVAVTRH